MMSEHSTHAQTSYQSAVAVCSDFSQVKAALERLEQHRFPSRQISLVARSLEDDSELHGYVDFGDRAERGAGVGALVGGICGALAGAAFFWIPGFGPLLVLGPLVSGMTGVVVGALVGAMMGWGIPADHAAEYERKVRNGKYLLIAHGDPQEVGTAFGALRDGYCDEVHLHAKTSADAPEIDDSPF